MFYDLTEPDKDEKCTKFMLANIRQIQRLAFDVTENASTVEEGHF